MGEHEELSKLLESSTEPEDVTARSDDGRLFFLSKEDAERMAFRKVVYIPLSGR
jgi:hypothetical protein